MVWKNKLDVWKFVVLLGKRVVFLENKIIFRGRESKMMVKTSGKGIREVSEAVAWGESSPVAISNGGAFMRNHIRLKY